MSKKTESAIAIVALIVVIVVGVLVFLPSITKYTIIASATESEITDIWFYSYKVSYINSVRTPTSIFYSNYEMDFEIYNTTDCKYSFSNCPQIYNTTVSVDFSKFTSIELPNTPSLNDTWTVKVTLYKISESGDRSKVDEYNKNFKIGELIGK